jgi:hypothetical protein
METMIVYYCFHCFSSKKHLHDDVTNKKALPELNQRGLWAIFTKRANVT